MQRPNRYEQFHQSFKRLLSSHQLFLISSQPIGIPHFFMQTFRKLSSFVGATVVFFQSVCNGLRFVLYSPYEQLLRFPFRGRTISFWSTFLYPISVVARLLFFFKHTSLKYTFTKSSLSKKSYFHKIHNFRNSLFASHIFK